jgi:hypothetical protein
MRGSVCDGDIYLYYSNFCHVYLYNSHHRKNIRIKKKDMIERNSLFVNLIVSSVIGRLDPSSLIMSLSFRSVFSIKEKTWHWFWCLVHFSFDEL